MIQLQPPPITTHFLVIVKGTEWYYFFYDDDNRHRICQSLAAAADNPELSFTWQDAARLADIARKNAAGVDTTGPHCHYVQKLPTPSYFKGKSKCQLSNRNCR